MTKKKIQKRVSTPKRAVKAQSTRTSSTSKNVYLKFAKDLWKRPATKYVLGGAVVASLVPVIMRTFRNHPEFGQMIRENMDAMEDRAENLGSIIKEKISSLREDELVDDARH